MLDKSKRYLIVGLGLLGGKYALELTRAGYTVDGINRSEGHLQFALDHGYIRSGKTHDFEDLVQSADHIIFGLYPTALIEWFRTYGHLLKPGCIFTDVSGVKTGLVEPIQALCPDGVEFIASHPMAGRETSSVEHAAEVNFAPANFIITPTEKNTPEAIQWAKDLAEVLGFHHICTLTVQEHDKMIGYVSQLCHAIAVSLMCANDNTSLCEYTGDSFRDLTRIARINDKMWAELFLWNKENLIAEIDQFDAALSQLRNALVASDRDKLKRCSAFPPSAAPRSTKRLRKSLRHRFAVPAVPLSALACHLPRPGGDVAKRQREDGPWQAGKVCSKRMGLFCCKRVGPAVFC